MQDMFVFFKELSSLLLIPSVVMFPNSKASSRIDTCGMIVYAENGNLRILPPRIKTTISPFTYFSVLHKNVTTMSF